MGSAPGRMLVTRTFSRLFDSTQRCYSLRGFLACPSWVFPLVSLESFAQGDTLGFDLMQNKPVTPNQTVKGPTVCWSYSDWYSRVRETQQSFTQSLLLGSIWPEEGRPIHK